MVLGLLHNVRLTSAFNAKKLRSPLHWLFAVLTHFLVVWRLRLRGFLLRCCASLDLKPFLLSKRKGFTKRNDHYAWSEGGPAARSHSSALTRSVGRPPTSPANARHPTWPACPCTLGRSGPQPSHGPPALGRCNRGLAWCAAVAVGAIAGFGPAAHLRVQTARASA